VIKRKFEPHKGQWAFPGGFLDIDTGETLDDASIRELEEETGAVGIPVEQLRTYGDPDRDCRDRVITTMYYALVSPESVDPLTLKENSDAADYAWVNLRKPGKKLAFDHAKIMKDLVKRLEKEAMYSPAPFDLVNKLFTWPEIHGAYEAMLGRSISNIRRKLRARYKIADTGKKKKVTSSRPPSLLKYNGEKHPL
jgi:8-oxo-dGTP diphosphatase